MKVKWTDEEIKLLKECYGIFSASKIVTIFEDNGFNRSKTAIISKCSKLKLKDKDIKTKICKKCKRELPMTIEYFRKDKTYIGGFRNICKECLGFHFTKDAKERNKYKTIDKREIYRGKINETHPELVKYFYNKEDVYEYSCTSNHIVKIKCPNCNSLKEMKITSFVHSKFSCPVCGDKIPFGEKLFGYILTCNKIKYKNQYSPSWAMNTRYDFYFEYCNKKYIVETHGRQHYEETNRGRSLEKEKENDKIKQQNALNNGIDIYVQLDCRKSEIDFILNNITSRDELNFLNINNINKEECIKTISKSLKIEACNMYNNGYDVKSIAKHLKLDDSTIRKWLVDLTKHNLCKYDGKFNSNNGNSKRIINLITNKKYNSISEASRKEGINRNRLSLYVKNKEKGWSVL